MNEKILRALKGVSYGQPNLTIYGTELKLYDYIQHDIEITKVFSYDTIKLVKKHNGNSAEYKKMALLLSKENLIKSKYDKWQAEIINELFFPKKYLELGQIK